MMKTRNGNTIKWNPNVKLIVSDVDETIADVYKTAEKEMIKELTRLLEEGKVLFLVTGQSIESMQWRIVDHIPKALRHKIIAGCCSGAEIWGFDKDGDLLRKPFYSLYDSRLTQQQREKFREVVKTVVTEFGLQTYSTMPEEEFRTKSEGDPHKVMIEDRRSQITLEVINGVDLSPDRVSTLGIKLKKINGIYDFRVPIMERAQQLLDQFKVPITARLAGTFAIDFAVKGVSKTTAVKYALESHTVLSHIELNTKDVTNPENIEVWGDKFSVINGGTDRHISEALPKSVRSIDFREEDSKEFLEGYNIVVWKGKQQLHNGLLEYLQSRD